MTRQGPEGWDVLLDAASDEVAGIARRAREIIRDAVPDASEEVDPSARLLGFTFAPGTYKGLFAGLILHTRHVNLMFSEGAELAAHSEAGALLEGTGKKARHIKLHTPEAAADPRITPLLHEAAARVRDRLAGS
ncbi:DUF1801 domain-containing protein [Streptomyces sp. NPDC087440]|uniref:DUF1801 domain-containing protein n=1 Tax=Streptomyces sp. NPDC087440 TaxID=3365790 RepID=UPI0038129399